MIKKYFRARRIAKTKQEIQAKRDWFMKNHREMKEIFPDLFI
jgi:hypothetical protein|tara:strand:- start:1114 stop:1239 length:126 start_codon:yes stop_codon:yes gene_type:complete